MKKNVLITYYELLEERHIRNIYEHILKNKYLKKLELHK